VIKQLTFAPRHHQLTNINTWTPDSQWLAFDVRPSGASFTGTTIERVNIQNGDVEVVYHAPEGAHVGVVTVNPRLPERYVFIHGPETPDADWHYDFHHRRGVVVAQGEASNLDAMDITSPYTPGALRGGSHVHVWSPDGSRLSFTYNDHVMHELDVRLDLRNVGVALPFGPVTPPKPHPREYGGSHYCVLVSRTTAEPQPGSDEINRAYEEGWVGEHGYRKPDGSVQRWALAFIGDTRLVNGEKVPELFIVDLPNEPQAYQQAGSEPLCGTATTLPAPPKSVMQRRLTFTHQRRYPGLVNQPRHWIRSSPDGSQLAFLMRDDSGVVQLWVISPNGGEPRQVTHGEHDIQSAFNWHPSGKALGFVQQGLVVLCDAQSGVITPLSSAEGEAPSGDAIVFSPNGKQVAWMQDVDGFRQLWSAETGL
jgi:dipeptidyl aminopeptidase/acylaminoacyl peptidase